MGWIRLSETAMEHPKITRLSDRAFRLWVGCLAYSQRYELDGFVPIATLKLFRREGSKKAISELVAAGLLSPVDGGYRLLNDEASPLFSFASAFVREMRSRFSMMRAEARRFLPWLLKQSDGRCVYCGTTAGPFHVDHVVPLSRGGTNDRSNLAPSCKDCNLRKGAASVLEFINAG